MQIPFAEQAVRHLALSAQDALERVPPDSPLTSNLSAGEAPAVL